MSIRAVSGERFLDELCEIFKLDPLRTTDIQIHLPAQEVVKIIVTSVVSELEAEALLLGLARYELVEVKEDQRDN